MAFVPSDAYIIMGHGQEPEIRPPEDEIMPTKFVAGVPTIGTLINDGFEDFDSAFIVPDNCMIVVKTRPGEITYSNTILSLLNKVGDASNQELFRNPLSNTKEVVTQLGSVMIYRPGEKCPNYHYILYSPDDIISKTYNSHIGLLKTPLVSPLVEKNWTEDINPDTTPISDYVRTVYGESVYPPPDLVLETLVKEHDESMKGTNEEGRPMTTSNIPWTAPHTIVKFFIITQKQLLQIGEDGVAKRPGVYYNFVCRVTPFKHTYYIKNASNRQVFNPNIQSVIGQKKSTRKVINRLIGEAETKRKPLIRNLYSGGKRTRKHRKRIRKPRV
jgi:hypothetical protein